MKRRKKILVWTAVALGGLLALGLIAYACLVWLTDARLEWQLAEIRAAGDPVTLADLARPPMPPEKNAATYLRQAKADLAAIEDALIPASPAANKFAKKLAEALRGRLQNSRKEKTVEISGADFQNLLTDDNIKEWKESYGGWLSEEPRYLMPPRIQNIVTAIFAAHPNTIPLLEQAGACREYDAQFDYTLPPMELQLTQFCATVNEFRSAARVLECRGCLLIAEGIATKP